MSLWPGARDLRANTDIEHDGELPDQRRAGEAAFLRRSRPRGLRGRLRPAAGADPRSQRVLHPAPHRNARARRSPSQGPRRTAGSTSTSSSTAAPERSPAGSSMSAPEPTIACVDDALPGRSVSTATAPAGHRQGHRVHRSHLPPARCRRECELPARRPPPLRIKGIQPFDLLTRPHRNRGGPASWTCPK